MKVLQKIQEARDLIKSNNIKKDGYNSYSGYAYYTPEQVDNLVYGACRKVSLFNKYNLKRTEFGLLATMEVYDLESGESETFNIATDMPDITATNSAQRLGGTVTYSNRYLLMNIYNIVDNTLDFDSQDNTKPGVEGNAARPISVEDMNKEDVTLLITAKELKSKILFSDKDIDIIAGCRRTIKKNGQLTVKQREIIKSVVDMYQDQLHIQIEKELDSEIPLPNN